MKREKDTCSYVNCGFILIPLVYLILFFVAPLVQMFRLSLFEFQGIGEPLGGFTWENYTKFLLDPYYWKVLGVTVGLSFLSGIFCAVMAYPISYKLCHMNGRAKHLITALAILPLWVPITVRMFGLMTIIPNGNYAAIEAGLIYCGLPYMIIILTGPIGNIEPSIIDASYVCGADFWTTFFRVTLPLTIPGIISGFMLVFALNTAAFIVPIMLGAGKTVTMTTLIYQQATYTYNWSFAAAISVIFMIVTLLLSNAGKLYEIHQRRKENKLKASLRNSAEIGEVAA